MNLRKVHEDKRGSIHRIKDACLECDEVVIFKTNRGYARGGCIHSTDEHFCVISGKVYLVTDTSGRPLNAGDSILIYAETPHYFKAITHCIVMEWGVPTKDKGRHDPIMRKTVEQINDSAN